jgi:protein transport protein SEC61 subunit gamma-like protein
MNIKENTKHFFIKCGRVWRVMKKPSSEEFKVISKVSLLGLLIIGFLGFAISIIVRAFTR